MNNRIQKTWEAYKSMAEPKAEGAELEKLKQAFFAGSATIFCGMMLAMSEDAEPTEEDMRLMADIQAEVDKFGQDLDVKLLGRIVLGRSH